MANANTDSDELFARRLQEEFDREEQSRQCMLESDSLLAKSVSAQYSYTLNSTDSESTSDVTDINNHNTSTSHDIPNEKEHTYDSHSDDSDSDITVDLSAQRDCSVQEDSSSHSDSDQSQSLFSSDSSPVESPVDIMDKPLCKYGAECYRKNPTHLATYAHPDKMGKRKVLPDKKDSCSKKQKTSDDSTPGTSSSAYCTPDRTCEVNNLGFYLTKVSGIPDKYNNHKTIDIKEILSPLYGKLLKSVQFNYMFDVPWLVSRYHVSFRRLPLLLIHGFTRGSKAELEREAAVFDHVRLSQARLDMMYGTHHTKMMILLYEEGLRVVIHTANLIDNDWHQKTQGVWMSPMFPRLKEVAANSSTHTSPNTSASASAGISAGPPKSEIPGDSTTHFKRDLLQYLRAYELSALNEWITVITDHDLSAARVHLVASVPGRHIGPAKSKYGHMKLRQILRECGPRHSEVSDWPVVGQFSSIGSLGPKPESWLTSEWLQSLATCKTPSTVQAKPPLKLEHSYNRVQIYPSKDNVRLSLEGYPGGGSLPYSINTAKKQQWLNDFLHQWRSEVHGRSRACPHIKTYLRGSGDGTSLSWFLVTSANLSKAAWGALEKNSSQLMIRSYELGILFCPEQFGLNDCFKVDAPTASAGFPVPYDLPPLPYTKGDRPWIWDIQYKDKPDSNGNIWCPP